MIAGAIALATFALHLATAWRYGYFRDELYFIACAHHLAWGYVDQPPLVAVVAWMAEPFGEGLTALRLPVLIASALCVYAAVRIARELGGGRYAQILAGVSVALLPAYLALGNILTTTSFEPLSWTLVVWCVIRLIRGAGAGTWIALTAAATFGLYGKYSMALLLAALAIGVALTTQRRLLATPWLGVASCLTLLLLAPNLWWQASHGWPFFAVLAGDAAHRHAFNNGWQLESIDLLTNARSFALEQALYTDPVAVPVWIAGLAAPFVWPRLRDLRFLTVAYVVLFIAAVALEAKGYYVIGIYAPLLCVGAVALERAAGWTRALILGSLVAVGLATAPLSIPVLPIHRFIAYTAWLGLTGRNGAPAHVIEPIFAEEFGWDRLAHDVAVVYLALPAAERRRTAIYADTYADAGAIDRYGPALGLPAAIGTQNNYFLWGTHGYSGEPMIAVGASRIDLLRRYYRSCALVRTSDEPLKWIAEGPSPIYLCSGPTMPLDRMWPHLRWYGA